MAGHIKPKKMLDFNIETLNFSISMGGIFVIFRNNLNRSWDFYHGANLGADATKPPCENGLWTCLICT
jgi:hypothetical protein